MKKQLEMWEATGYEAQKKQIEKAGLNPGILYGGSGAGGQTTNIAQGTVGMGAAPSAGGENIQVMGMMAQIALVDAQRKKIEAAYAIRKFLERWRKKFKKSLRHWLVTELGHNGTENIHLHGIVWTDENYSTIREKWAYGFIYPRTEEQERKGYVNAKTVNYIVKYITKRLKFLNTESTCNCYCVPASTLYMSNKKLLTCSKSLMILTKGSITTV